MYLQEIYRLLHPNVYFTPEKVKEFLKKEREEQYVPDWKPTMAKPPYKVK